MSMDISGTKLQSLANTLLTQDKDKVITEAELKAFVASNEDELTTLNIGAADVANELRNILKDNMETADVKKGATDTKGATGDNLMEEYNRIQEQIEEYKKSLKNMTLKSIN